MADPHNRPIGGQLVRARSLCTDFRLTQQTVHILGELDYDVVAFTHGPEIVDRARGHVRAFLSHLSRG